jgi:PAS domain S-box-containing protein
LGWRLATATITFSTFIALLATAIQLYLDYRRDLTVIDATFDQVGQSYLPTIASALWQTNRHELTIAINGLARLPDVQHVTVYEDSQPWAEAGTAKTKNVRKREFPLTHVHRNETIPIGTLSVVMDLDGVYQRLWDKFWVILITNSIKTFLVAGFMLWLFRWLVTRHLHRVAEFAARLGTENLQARLALDRPQNRKSTRDELDMVLEGFGRMQNSLASSLGELRESEARFRVLFEQAAVGVAQLDTHTGAFVRINRKYCDILGYSHDEMLQLDFRSITPPDDVQAVLSRMQELKAGTIHEFSLEKRYIRKDGSLVWVNVNVSRMGSAGEPPNYHIAVVEDISARKEAESQLQQLNITLEQRVIERTAQLEAANQELEAFSYSVSHDLRAPLRGIDGFSRILAEDYHDRLDQDGRDHIGRVRRATQHMGMLIDNMLRLSRVTRANLAQTDVDLSRMAADVMAELEKADPRQRPAFSVEPGLAAWGDAALLRIVLENLLDNARKYSGKSPHPRIEFGCTMQRGRMAYFVRDNGAGFDMAYAGRLFGAFQRMHHADEFPGTGIGLATVKRIIRRHDGDIWAESEVGKGATFFFTLGERRNTQSGGYSS